MRAAAGARLPEAGEVMDGPTVAEMLRKRDEFLVEAEEAGRDLLMYSEACNDIGAVGAQIRWLAARLLASNWELEAWRAEREQGAGSR